MIDSPAKQSFRACRAILQERLAEPAPGRIQLLAGPRQVGKTTLLLELADTFGGDALYVAADGPESALPGFWERLLHEAETRAENRKKAVLLIDEIHLLPDWAARLKGIWDRFRRRRIPVHIVATGSSALHLATGSKESLAGRFERLCLTHWSAGAVQEAFQLGLNAAAEAVVRIGGYPGAYPLRKDVHRWAAYVRDAILEPAIGRDILALEAVRKPALLRQVFAAAAASPAQIVSLQKLQGQLQDAGAIETIAHYLTLLEQAFLVAALPKYTSRKMRARASPPKLVTLNNALVAVLNPAALAERRPDPSLWGQWVENACLAHAWNSGQTVSYWREKDLEVDGVIEGSWGKWAIEVKTGPFQERDVLGLLEFTRHYPAFKPLVLVDANLKRAPSIDGVAMLSWQRFLAEEGPSGDGKGISSPVL